MPKLFIADRRMLALLEYAIEKGIEPHEKAMLERIEFPRTNISNVRAGTQGFTKHHIFNMAKATGANINWIFGLENNMMRGITKRPIALLKEAVVIIEQELKKGSNRNSNK